MALRRIGVTWHDGVSRLPQLVARTYLNGVGAILKRLPDTLWKRRIVNSITQVRWDARLTFTPQPITLGKDIVVRLTPHLNEFDFEALFFRQLPYESEVFEWIAARFNRYDAIVEIGANVGVFTLFLGTLARQSRKSIPVFAFEPSRQAYQRLLANLSANSLFDIVTPFNIAIANENGFVSFYEPEGHLTNGSLQRDFSEQFSERIQQGTVFALDASQLESLLQPYQRILLKIDVEGAEAMILQALQPFIQKKTPDIILEVLPVTQPALNALAFLTELYQLSRITPTGAVNTAAFVADVHRDYWLTPLKEG